MNVDILASMVIYCVATVAFYLLGAGILHTQGLVPSANDMIAVLSKLYTETLGPWALPLFYIGAIATLYGTIFAATAGNSRVLHLVIPVCMYLIFRSPVTMVKVGGFAQALMLPVLSVGALYLRHRGLPKEIAPGRVATASLWFAALVITAVMAYSLVLTVQAW
jgi:hypothetical protein